MAMKVRILRAAEESKQRVRYLYFCKGFILSVSFSDKTKMHTVSFEEAIHAVVQAVLPAKPHLILPENVRPRTP